MPFNSFRPTSPDYSDTVAGGVRDTSSQAFDLLLKLLSAVGEGGNALQSMGNPAIPVLGPAAAMAGGIGRGARATGAAGARLLKNLKPLVPMTEAVADKPGFFPGLAEKVAPLVAAAKAGDENALNQLATELQPVLIAASRSMEKNAKARGTIGWNSDDALSAMGEQFPRLVREYDPAKGKFPNYVSSYSQGAAREELRKVRRHQAGSVDDPRFEEGTGLTRNSEGRLSQRGGVDSEESDPEAIASAFARLDLSKLPKRQAEIVQAWLDIPNHEQHQNVFAEVAAKTGLKSQNAARITFNEAMATLRKQMSAKPMSGGSTSQYPEPDPNIIRQLHGRQNLSDMQGAGNDPAALRHPLAQRDEAARTAAREDLHSAGYGAGIEAGDYTPGMPMSSSTLEPAPGMPGEWVPARGTARPIMDIKWESWDQTPESPPYSLRRPR